MVRHCFLSAAALLGLALAGCETGPRETAFDKRCWIRGADGQLAVLDADVENLETCGARLAVRHIQWGAPVSGAFGGVEVFVDANAIEAGTPYGDRIRLLSDADRARIDAAIRLLLEAQSAGGGEAVAAGGRILSQRRAAMANL